MTSSSIVDRRRLGARQHHTPVWVRQACRSWVAGGRVGRPKSSTTQTVTASGNQLLLLLLLLHLLRGRGRRGDGAWQGPVTGRASGRGRGRCSLCGSRWARRGFSISARRGAVRIRIGLLTDVPIGIITICPCTKKYVCKNAFSGVRKGPPGRPVLRTQRNF